MGLSVSRLQTRIQKLERRSLAHGLDARPDRESKRFVIARIEAIRQRLQAARDRGEYVPRIEAAEVKERLRALLEGRDKRA